MILSTKHAAQFQRYITFFYSRYSRSFPWRSTQDPYRILVSELMLQQTQTDRVVAKYEKFIEKYTTAQELSKATLAQVFSLWQGLGYNRRAKFLLETAKIISSTYAGLFPGDEATLTTLPGIGPYTASAVLAFAFNKPVTFIETNIRTVYIYHFFPQRQGVHDKELLPLIEQTVDQKNARDWYYALMDYGVILKKLFPNPNRKSKHYTKQSKFDGSNRQVRGMILKLLLAQPYKRTELVKQIPRDEELSQQIIEELLKEGMIVQLNDSLVLSA